MNIKEQVIETIAEVLGVMPETITHEPVIGDIRS